MPDLSRTTRLIGANLGLAGVYAVVGTLSLLVGQFTGLAAPVWPAAGVAFAVVYQRGWHLLPGVFVGSFLVNITALLRGDGTVFSTALPVVTAIALGAALQAFVGGSLVRKLIGIHATLSRGGQVLAFLLLAGPIACVVNPTVGVLTQLAGGVISGEQAALGWLTWWIGDSIGVIVFAPITLMLLPEQADIWRGRRWKIAIPSIVAVTVFAALFLQSAAQENRRLEEEVSKLGTAAANDLSSNALQHQEVLEGVRSFINASENVTPEEFDAFTRGALERFPNLQAISWNRAISNADLPAFEAEQRREPGRADFTVTELDAENNLRPAQGGDDHVVVTFIEPIAENRSALGFDIQSNPTRVEAIMGARDSGEARATAPIELVQENGSQKGMLALVPVYDGVDVPATVADRREQLRGFAVGVYRLGDLLADTFATPEWNDVQIDLVDATGSERELISTRPAVNAPVVDEAIPVVRRAAGEPIEIFGRTWQLVVTPTSGPLAATARPMAPGLLFSGLLVLGLLEAFLLLLTGLERQARREADVSTFHAQHDSLTGLPNRRSFMDQLEIVCKRAVEEESPHVLMYLDLDGLKRVNDLGGHAAGDAFLIGAAALFREHVRSRDVVARLGGDEFGIILNNCGEERALAIADSIVTAVGEFSVNEGGKRLSGGASIGITVIDTAEPHELLRRADAACYTAKRSGKGQVRVFHRAAD